MDFQVDFRGILDQFWYKNRLNLYDRFWLAFWWLAPARRVCKEAARRLRGGGKEAARRRQGGGGPHISPAQPPWSGALNKKNLGN